MRVLLCKLGPGETAEDLEALAGRPVHAAPGSARVVGRVVRVEVDGRDVWGVLELDEAFLPHEVFCPPVSIARVSQRPEISRDFSGRFSQ